ncbi:Nephrocystin-3 [Trichoplax sp. H2]|nr:Nephrocystin-3 [Trichoplax sp. H2]|eukprot:RDD37550.1 Nephrocystin-3 [Trichoplax sp. H2]
MGSRPSKSSVPEAVKSLRQKGHNYFNARNYNQARKCYEQALDKIEAITYASIEQDQFRCDVYVDICDTYRGQGKNSKADKFNQIARKIALELDDGIRIAKCLDRQGAIKSLKNDFTGALEYLKGSLELKLKILGDHNLDVAASYYNLGNIYQRQKIYDKAVSMHQKALDIRLTLRGRNHTDVANSYDLIGNAYRRQNKHIDALLMYQNALTIRQELLGEYHADVADSYNNMGNAYKNQSMYDNALSTYQKALEIYMKISGENIPEVALLYRNMANVYEKQDNTNDAAAMHKKLTAVKEKLKSEAENRKNVRNSKKQGGLIEEETEVMTDDETFD